MFGIFKKDAGIQKYTFCETYLCVILDEYNYPLIKEKELRYMAFAIFSFYTFLFHGDKNASKICDSVANSIIQKYGNNVLKDLRHRNIFYFSYLEVFMGIKESSNQVSPDTALALELIGNASIGFDSVKTNILELTFSMQRALLHCADEIKKAKF